MIESILVEAKVKCDYVKFTVTSDNKLRIKVPIYATPDDIETWTQLGIEVFNKIAPVDRTLRGKIHLDGAGTHVKMYNDAKTHFKRVDFY